MYQRLSSDNKEEESHMTRMMDRRSVLKIGGGLLAAAALAPRSALAQDASLSYWHTFTSQSEIAGLDEVLKLFAAGHSAIAVAPEAIPNPEFMAKITAATVAKSLPNV